MLTSEIRRDVLEEVLGLPKSFSFLTRFPRSGFLRVSAFEELGLRRFLALAASSHKVLITLPVPGTVTYVGGGMIAASCLATPRA